MINGIHVTSTKYLVVIILIDLDSAPIVNAMGKGYYYQFSPSPSAALAADSNQNIDQKETNYQRTYRYVHGFESFGNYFKIIVYF